jgi:hypothetical protein
MAKPGDAAFAVLRKRQAQMAGPKKSRIFRQKAIDSLHARA